MAGGNQGSFTPIAAGSGSGEVTGNRWENVEHLGPRDEVKLVLSGRADYEWAVELLRARSLAERAGTVLLSPVWGELDPKELVAWVIADRLPVRVQIQAHKYIWGPATQSV